MSASTRSISIKRQSSQREDILSFMFESMEKQEIWIDLDKSPDQILD